MSGSARIHRPSPGSGGRDRGSKSRGLRRGGNRGGKSYSGPKSPQAEMNGHGRDRESPGRSYRGPGRGRGEPKHRHSPIVTSVDALLNEVSSVKGCAIRKLDEKLSDVLPLGPSCKIRRQHLQLLTAAVHYNQAADSLRKAKIHLIRSLRYCESYMADLQSFREAITLKLEEHQESSKEGNLEECMGMLFNILRIDTTEFLSNSGFNSREEILSHQPVIGMKHQWYVRQIRKLCEAFDLKPIADDLLWHEDVLNLMRLLSNSQTNDLRKLFEELKVGHSELLLYFSMPNPEEAIKLGFAPSTCEYEWAPVGVRLTELLYLNFLRYYDSLSQEAPSVRPSNNGDVFGSSEPTMPLQDPSPAYSLDLYKEIPLFPRFDELLNADSIIPRNCMFYESISHYLDTHVRLLREDYIWQFRESILRVKSIQKNVERQGWEDAFRKEKLKVFTNVTVSDIRVRHTDFTSILQLDVNQPLVQRVLKYPTAVLRPGSLLCLSYSQEFCDDHDILWGIMAPNFDSELAPGQMNVRIFNGSNEVFPLTPDPGQSFGLVECPVYFESYRHTLYQLQNLETLLADRPSLSDLLVCPLRETKPPRFMHQNRSTLNAAVLYGMSAAAKDEAVKTQTLRIQAMRREIPQKLSDQEILQKHLGEENVAEQDTIPNVSWIPTEQALPSSIVSNSGYQRPLMLDETQLKAFHYMLNSEVALVQGPPGTGKTYLGSKYVQFLLENRKTLLGNRPILVITKTNHAVDQFTSHILESGVSNVVRLGSRSKDERLSKLTIQDARKRLKIERSKSLATNVAPERDLIPDKDDIKQQLIDHYDKLLFGNKLKLENLKNVFFDLKTVQPDIFSNSRKRTVLLNKHDFGRVNPYDSGCDVSLDGYMKLVWRIFLLTVASIEQRNDEIHEKKRSDENCQNYYSLKSFIQDFLNTVDDDDDGSSEGAASLHKTERRMQFAERLDIAVNEEDSFLDQAEEESRIDEVFDATISDDQNSLGTDRATVPVEQDESEMNEEEWEKVPTSSKTAKKRMNYLNKLNQRKDRFMSPQRLETLAWHTLRNDPTKASDNVKQLLKLPQKEKDQLILGFVSVYVKIEKAYFGQLAERFLHLLEQLEEHRIYRDTQTLKQVSVIAATINGAARRSKLLLQTAPSVVIIEEAAEVLEADIAAMLSMQPDQLVLIGDHMQLRPKPATYELQRYHSLDVSMFERFIEAGYPYEHILTQRRMRPAFADIIRLYYAELEDHASCCSRETLAPGLPDLWFLDHTYPETEPKTPFGKCNKKEAEVAIRIALLLLQRNVLPSQIAIVTPYVDQLLELRQLREKTVRTQVKAADLRSVRISVLDNFQGEEADCIILSCVRSHGMDRSIRQGIGFLSNENRVNVALSRARTNMLVLGNFSHLCKYSPFWKKVCSMMEERGCFGSALPVRCPNHEDTLLQLKNAQDFIKKAPDGGCSKLCGKRLSCGHTCQSICHLVSHENITCKRQCQKKLECGHVCPRICSQQCAKASECKMKVKVTLACGHRTQKRCHQKLESIVCNQPCEEILSCGHTCGGKCGTCKTYGHPSCKKECGRKLICSHVCKHKCTSTCPPCEKQCPRKCLHSSCDHPCKELCVPCKEPCSWECPHKKCSKLCYEVCDRDPCEEPCPKHLPCGHQCKGYCGEVCPDLCFECENTTKVKEIMMDELTDTKQRYIAADCGHVFGAQAFDMYMESTYLHLLKPSNSSERHNVELPRCMADGCKKPLYMVNRYQQYIKAAIEQVDQVKHRIKEAAEERRQNLLQMLDEKDKVVSKLESEKVSSLMPAGYKISRTESLDSLREEMKSSLARLPQDLQSWPSEAMKSMALNVGLLGIILHALTLSDLKETKKAQKQARQALLKLVREEFVSLRDDFETSHMKMKFQAYFLQLRCLVILAEPRTENNIVRIRNRAVTASSTRFNEEEMEVAVGKIREPVQELENALWNQTMSKEELYELLKALAAENSRDFSAGHWHKCGTCGYLFAIGNCGGAMEESTCPDCKNRIGGQSHTLNANTTIADDLPGDHQNRAAYMYAGGDAYW